MTTASTDPITDSAGEGTSFPLVLGLDTFGDVTHDDDGRPLSHALSLIHI